VTLLVSLATRPRPDSELRGLVWSLTERPNDEDTVWWARPATVAVFILIMLVGLNIVFF
jgi:SSS family solute:Na+ symporter